VIGRNKSAGSDVVPGEILKLGVEAMIPYLVRFLDIRVNNVTNPGDWKRHSGSYLHEEGWIGSHKLQKGRSALTSVACKQWNTS
jgi:hypothetical protein